MSLFINLLFSNPELFAAISLMVIFSICLHEYVHARMALFEGDPTAADAGHLTLNPLKQMGISSLVMFAIIGIAWGQVPVNPYRMRRKYSPALVAFAGPCVNLILFFVFTAVFTVTYHYRTGELVQTMFSYAAMLNVVLFMLNILPIPGLDGWTVLCNFFPRIDLRNSEWVKGISLLMLLAVIMGSKYLFWTGAVLVQILTMVFLKVFF